jgi:hypothetical protein
LGFRGLLGWLVALGRDASFALRWRVFSFSRGLEVFLRRVFSFDVLAFGRCSSFTFRCSGGLFCSSGLVSCNRFAVNLGGSDLEVDLPQGSALIRRPPTTHGSGRSGNGEQVVVA